MIKQKLFLTSITFFLISSVFSQTKYACFENDKNKNLKISVSFNKNNRATSVKYGGQKDSIRLFYSRIVKVKNDGIPAYYWAETYLEKDKGKVAGEYIFTNAGTYQLDVTYLRKRDNKEFYFSIIEGKEGVDDPPFHFKSCW